MTTELAPAIPGQIDSWLEENKAKVASALARKIPEDYFLSCIKTAVRRVPSLMKCERLSLLDAIFQSAQCHLPVGDGTHRACIVPYGKEAQFQIMVRGLIDHAYKSGQVKSICAEVVYEEDDFFYRLGTDPEVRHTPPMSGTKDIEKAKGAYAIAETVMGGKVVEIMSRDQILGIRARSKAFQRNSGPWTTDEPEMHRKTVLRRLCKKLPPSVFPTAVHSSLELEDARDFKNAREAQVVIDAPAPVALPEPTVKELQDELCALLSELDGPVSEALLDSTGIIESVRDCKDRGLLTKAIAAAKEG